MYLPQHVYKDALELQQQYADTYFICGELSNIQDEKYFFDTLEHKELFFYDIIAPERNIFYPACFLYGLYVKFKIGTKRYKNYMRQGALFALLYKYGFKIEKVHIRYAGAFAAVYARKV